MKGQSGASQSHIGGPNGRPAGATVAQTDHASFVRLKKRSEFLAVAKGMRHHESAFTLQALADESGQEPACRIGLTVTKKTGNSVERNRIRRRLREALRLGGMARGEIATGKARDYVVVARRETLSRGFDLLQADLARAFERIERRIATRKSKKAHAQDE